MKKKIKRPDLVKRNRDRYKDKTWEGFHGKEKADKLRKKSKENCNFKEINKSRMNKSYEEIYGEEKGKRMKEAKKKDNFFKEFNKTRKGKKYEDLYDKDKVKEYKKKLSETSLGRVPPNKINIDFNEVLPIYKKLKSCKKTGEYFKCTGGVISRILKKNNFPFFKQESSKKMNLNEEEVIKSYKKIKNALKVGKKFNCSIHPIVCILKKHNIPTYGFQGSSGEENPNWRGGLSFEPYTLEFNLKFKNFIRKRDNQCCMVCGIHREKIRRALCVHHVNYDKKLSIPQNCVSLCDHCHGLTSFRRKYWQKFFQSLLAERYVYKYSETGEVILDYTNPSPYESSQK